MSKAVFNRHKVIFEERDIERDPQAEAEFLDLVGNGPHSVPRILFQSDKGGEMETVETLIEPSPMQLVQALQSHGYIIPQPVG